MTNYVLKLKPLAITKIVVAMLIMVMGVLLAVKNGGTTEADKHAMLGGGTIIIAIGTFFCITKPEVLYFFGIIFFFIGSFGLTTYALTGPQSYLIMALPNGFALLDIMTIQLTLVVGVMMLVVMRIGKHFLWDDRVLTDELY